VDHRPERLAKQIGVRIPTRRRSALRHPGTDQLARDGLTCRREAVPRRAAHADRRIGAGLQGQHSPAGRTGLPGLTGCIPVELSRVVAAATTRPTAARPPSAYATTDRITSGGLALVTHAPQFTDRRASSASPLRSGRRPPATAAACRTRPRPGWPAQPAPGCRLRTGTGGRHLMARYFGWVRFVRTFNCQS
jgi:hypothetical protein